MKKDVEILLKEVVDEHGIYDCINKERCQELISSKYGALREEFVLLANAIEYGIVQDLIKLKYQFDSEKIRELLVSRIMVRMNVSLQEAQWILNVWAYALGIDKKASNDIDKIRIYKNRIVVGKDSEEGYDSLYEALKDIKPKGEILIHPGIYYGHYKIDKPVTIRGLDKNNVILESDMVPIFTVLETDGVNIENLTIRGISRTERDKIHLVEIINSGVQFVNCNITRATLSGIFCYGKKSDIMIVNSDVSLALRSGIIVSDDAKCTLDNSNVYLNTDSQIVARDNANLFIVRSRIYDGKSAGVKLINEANLVSDDSAFYSNNRAGIIISYNSCATIRNSSIHNNRGYGIIISDMSCTTIEKCQIYQNTISGIRFDKGSDLFNYSSNVNDRIVTISGSRDDLEEGVKSDAIDEYVKNPPDIEMESPPDTLQSIVIMISFILIFEVTGLIAVEILGILLSKPIINIPTLIITMGITGFIFGLIFIINRSQ